MIEESIKQYGDLTEDELAEFLHEIESEDDELIAAQQDVVTETTIKSEMSEDFNPEYMEKTDDIDNDLLPEEMMTDDAWSYFREWEQDKKTGRYTIKGLGLQLQSEAHKQAVKNAEIARAKLEENRRLRKQQKTDITRMAFDQKLIDLSEKIPEHQLSRLIYILTKDHTYMINKLEAYINKRLTTLLRPFIPKIVKTCYDRHPQSMIVHPGFMYEASKEYGNGLKIWVNPKIPYFFSQFSEMQILRQNKAPFLYALDKAVEQYYRHRDLRTEKEIKYATRLVGMKTKTYYGLLQFNPFWFKLLYEDYKKGLEEYMAEKGA